MINEIQTMGSAVFAKWDKLDAWCCKWAKEYFGNHADAVTERDEEDFCIAISGLRKEDFEAFSTLFVQHDKYGYYDPEEEFETGIKYAVLPVCISIGVMNKFAGKLGLTHIGHAVANYNGVYFMENEWKYDL